MTWRAILRRDLCAYCLRPQAGTVDHIRPRRRATRRHRHAGGPNTIDNLTAACEGCNHRKADRPLLLFIAAHGYPARGVGTRVGKRAEPPRAPAK